jgi:hypothetical protein
MGMLRLKHLQALEEPISTGLARHGRQIARAIGMRSACLLGICLLAGGGLCASGQSQGSTIHSSLTKEETQAMVKRVLQTEILESQDSSHPMQYLLKKTSPRLSTTKLILETKDGDVARLLAVNDQVLGQQEKQVEDARLQQLISDPRLQRHRQEREQGDAERLRKVMRALPDAFVYQFAGVVQTPGGSVYRMTFQPNPDFDPQDLEAQVLKAMAGELWIDVAQQRVTKLEGKRLHAVDYGWGILGKLDEGGTLLLEQEDVGSQQWRTTKMVLVMNARVFLKSVKLDTTLELSQFSPLKAGLGYQQAVQMLRGDARANAESIGTPDGAKALSQ